VPNYDKAMDYILLGHKTTEERISLVLKSTEYYELLDIKNSRLIDFPGKNTRSATLSVDRFGVEQCGY
jgi:hypothetical protein